MSHWSLKRAARFGYLAGRGCRSDPSWPMTLIAARSERARLRVGAWRSRSGVPFTIPLPAEDRYVLEFAADAHGVSTAGLAAQ
jgi:hypothetical protein